MVANGGWAAKAGTAPNPQRQVTIQSVVRTQLFRLKFRIAEGYTGRPLTAVASLVLSYPVAPNRRMLNA